MTTITRTAPETGFRGGIDVRVSIRENAGDGASPFDGAWFPRTRDLAVEVPELIAELDRRGVRVERFTYALDAWSPVPRKVVVQGRTVRTGGFRSMDPGVVCLTWAGGLRRADLLVVPPETDVLTGARALRLCTRRGLPPSPQMVLAAARSTPLPQVPEDRPAVCRTTRALAGSAAGPRPSHRSLAVSLRAGPRGHTPTANRLDGGGAPPLE